MTTTAYPAILETAEDGGLGIWFPDFPGCVSAIDSDSAADAMASATEALALHVEGMIEDGEPLPRPSSPHALGPEDVGERFVTMIFVPVAVPKAPPVTNARVNVILPETLLARIDATARRLGMNRSSFLAKAARQQVEESDIALRKRRRG